jgi:hypothetical protein
MARLRGGGRGVARILVAGVTSHRFLRIEAEVLGVGTEETAGIDRRRNNVELFALKRLEIAPGDAGVAFGVFQGEPAGLSGADQPRPKFTHDIPRE